MLSLAPLPRKRAGKLEGDCDARGTNPLSRCEDLGIPERYEPFFGDEREVYANCFPVAAPARSTVQVGGLPKDALVGRRSLRSVRFADARKNPASGLVFFLDFSLFENLSGAFLFGVG